MFRKFRTNGRIAFKYAILTGLSALKTAVLGRFWLVLAAIRYYVRLAVQSGETIYQTKKHPVGRDRQGVMFTLMRYKC